jgi:hypothetical protein
MSGASWTVIGNSDRLIMNRIAGEAFVDEDGNPRHESGTVDVKPSVVNEPRGAVDSV